jgi:hypothetical protein
VNLRRLVGDATVVRGVLRRRFCRWIWTWPVTARSGAATNDRPRTGQQHFRKSFRICSAVSNTALSGSPSQGLAPSEEPEQSQPKDGSDGFSGRSWPDRPDHPNHPNLRAGNCRPNHPAHEPATTISPVPSLSAGLPGMTAPRPPQSAVADSTVAGLALVGVGAVAAEGRLGEDGPDVVVDLDVW